MTAGNRRGVTLIEMLVVMALISLLAGISFPAVSSGLESLRLRGAADNVASFFHLGLSFAERRQQTLELEIDRSRNRLAFRSVVPGFFKDFLLPEGITISALFPPVPAEDRAPVRILLYPGATFPRIGVELTNLKGSRRLVRLDPVTGMARIEIPAEREPE